MYDNTLLFGNLCPIRFISQHDRSKIRFKNVGNHIYGTGRDVVRRYFGEVFSSARSKRQDKLVKLADMCNESVMGVCLFPMEKKNGIADVCCKLPLM